MTFHTKGGYYGYLDRDVLKVATFCPYVPTGTGTHLGFRTFLRAREPTKCK